MFKKLSIIFLMFVFVGKVSAPNLSMFESVDLRNRMILEQSRLLYEKEFGAFIQHLGHKESNNNWKVMNSIGCMGEWQFAPATLKHLGYSTITPTKFKENPNIFPPELQQKVLRELIRVNMIGIKPYLKYIGQVINGITITKSGLMAGMHLGGLGGVRQFLTSNGAIDRGDMNGICISDYIREFAHYRI
jgi:hypothetical protein